MEGKINSKGWLEIKRANDFKEHGCPFDPAGANSIAKCGDWCPLFGEPKTVTLYGFAEIGKNIPSDTTLQICQNCTLIFDKFTDERK